MKAIFGEGDEGKIISVFETTKDIICIENDNNDMMKIQITRKEDIWKIWNENKSKNHYFETI